MDYATTIAKKYNDIVTSIVEKQKNHSIKKEIYDKKKDGYKYTIETEEAKLLVFISTKEIGYDLDIHPKALGREIGTSLDTDLYALDYDQDITEEIAEETVQCVKGFLRKDIYIGKDNNKYYLGVPIKNGYRLEKKKRSIFGYVIDEEELSTVEIKKKKFLRPIK